jgi:hypothetical protein
MANCSITHQLSSSGERVAGTIRFIGEPHVEGRKSQKKLIPRGVKKTVQIRFETAFGVQNATAI